MSTRQPSKSKPGLVQSKHGRQGKENPRQGLNSRKLRASSLQKQTKQTENVDPPNSSKDCLPNPKGGDGSGGGGDETQSPEQNKNTGSTTQPEVTMSDTKSPSNGDKNDPKTGIEETNNAVFKRKDGEKENKHSQSKKKPVNTKSNESQHRDKSETKRTEDKHKPTKKPSKGDNKQNRGKTDTKHSEHEKNDKPETTKENGESDCKNTQNENQETNDQPNGADSTQNEEDELQLQKQKKKRSLDEDSLQMFLSTDDIADDNQRPWMGPDQYSDETKRKQEEIIRRILEEFDLEETMKKYRNSNVLVYRRDGKSLADFRFRSELIRMMGSEEIRLNDQEWSRKFEEKLREDYNRLLDQQEYNLAQAEKKRIHRLRVEGVITDDRDLEDLSATHGSGSEYRVSLTPHIIAHKPVVSLRNKSRGDPATPKRRSQEELLHCKPVFPDEESNRRERNLLAHRQEKIYYPPEDVQTQMGRMERGDEEGKSVETDHKYGQGSESLACSSTLDPDSKDHVYGVSTSTTARDEEGQGGRTLRKIRKNLPPCIARLYKEETTSGLYNLAAELLGLPESSMDDRGNVKSRASETERGQET